MSNETDKAVVRDAIRNYMRQYGDAEISLVDLRGYVRSTTKGLGRNGGDLDFSGPTLAAMLKPMGYVRDGVRKIDTCPGKSTFYVKVTS